MSEVVERKRSWLNWRLLVRLAIAAAVLAFLASKIEGEKLSAAFLSAKPQWLLAAASCYVVILSLATVRWNLLLRIQGIQLPMGLTFQLTMIGHFFNAFLLGTTGGDVIKIFYAMRHAPGKKAKATLSILMDRVIGLMALLFLAACVLPGQLTRLSEQPETKWLAYFMYGLLAAGVVGLLSAHYIPLHRLPKLLHNLWSKVPRREILEELYHGFREHGKAFHLTLSASVLAILLHSVNFTAGYFVALSLGIDTSFWTIFVIMAIAVTVMGVPLMPGGFVVREGIFVLMLGAFGLAEEEVAIAFSLLFYAASTVWSLVGGGIYLLFQHEAKKEHDV